jgi:hypothetical protein
MDSAMRPSAGSAQNAKKREVPQQRAADARD